MASIMAFRWYETDIEDKRDLAENIVRNKIKLKTDERVNWTTLRRMAPVPAWNDSHPTEPGFYLDFIKPKHVSRLVWELEAEYTLIKGGQVDSNPLSRPADISFDTSLIEVPTFFDSSDKPIVTSAGEFIPGVVQKIPTVDYSITKNLPADPAWLLTHIGGINASPMRIRGVSWPRKTLLLGAVSAGAFVTEERATYTEYKLKLLGNPLTWTNELWNVGTIELTQVQRHINGRIRTIWVQKPILRGTPPAPVDDPVPLDRFGKAIVDYLDPGSGDVIKTGTLNKLYYDTQRIVDLSILPLV